MENSTSPQSPSLKVKLLVPQKNFQISFYFFFLLFSFYSLTQGRSNFDFCWDGYCRFMTMRSIFLHGTPVVEGIEYKYNVGASVGMLPIYLLGETLNYFFSTTIDFAQELCLSFYTIVTALTVVTLFNFMLLLGRPFKTSLVVACLYGIATAAWPYAGDMQSEPLVALCITYSLLLISKIKTGNSKPESAGFVLALAVLTRPEILLAYLPLTGYLIYLRLCSKEVNSDKTIRIKSLLTCVIRFTLSTSLGIIGILVWNYWRYKSPWVTGYTNEGFNTPLLVGLHGLLFSVGKGVFFFNPVLLITGIGWSNFYQEKKAEAVTIVLLLFIFLVVYAKFDSWGGGPSWGPRFLISFLPLALLPLGWTTLSESFPVKIFLGFIVAISVYIQILGTFVPQQTVVWYKTKSLYREIEIALNVYGKDDNILFHYIPYFSPIRIHAKALVPLKSQSRLFPYDLKNNERKASLPGLFFSVLFFWSFIRMLLYCRKQVNGLKIG